MPPLGPRFARRAVLAGGATVLAASLASYGRGALSALGPRTTRLAETRAGGRIIAAVAQERALMLGTNSGPTPAWLYADAPFPVFRLHQGEELNVRLDNRLPEHSSIHWHGIRGPNAMDGVAYVTQDPVLPGENFTYRFTPPDPGTFFFHPHCNTAEQLGRGLAGVLIVEEDEDEFDDDVVIVLKDWRVAEDGVFLPFLTLEGAGRSGTFGTLRTANGVVAPEITVPAGANIRLRILNFDSTRVGDIGIQGADAAIIAVDGNRLVPFALESWRLGPAMRMDVALRTPASGETVRLVDYFSAEPVILATLIAEGAPRHSGSFAPPVAKPVSLPEPDLEKAEAHQLRLSASAAPGDYSGLAPIVLPDGRKIDLLDSLCANGTTLWEIDGKPWPQTGHEYLPPPLMDLRRGVSVRIEFLNTTSRVHPMHLHGHTFKVLSSTKLQRPVHWADTVLVMPEERVQVAFVADNPGNWMLHCHLIEHQDTGMMAWFRVA